jgi:hypothetical protein
MKKQKKPRKFLFCDTHLFLLHDILLALEAQLWPYAPLGLDGQHDSSVHELAIPSGKARRNAENLQGIEEPQVTGGGGPEVCCSSSPTHTHTHTHIHTHTHTYTHTFVYILLDVSFRGRKTSPKRRNNHRKHLVTYCRKAPILLLRSSPVTSNSALPPGVTNSGSAVQNATQQSCTTVKQIKAGPVHCITPATFLVTLQSNYLLLLGRHSHQLRKKLCRWEHGVFKSRTGVHCWTLLTIKIVRST